MVQNSRFTLQLNLFFIFKSIQSFKHMERAGNQEKQYLIQSAYYIVYLAIVKSTNQQFVVLIDLFFFQTQLRVLNDVI